MQGFIGGSSLTTILHKNFNDTRASFKVLVKQQVTNINLSSRLAPVLEQALDYTPNISNHIRYNVVSSSSSI